MSRISGQSIPAGVPTPTDVSNIEIERAATAYHEAGHAVVSSTFGRMPTKITITSDEDGCAGRTWFADDFKPEYQNRHNHSEEKQSYTRMRVVVAVAGIAAHDLWSPQREYDLGDICDENRARTIIEQTVRWDNSREAYLERCKLEATELLRENWSKVEALVQALLERDTLTSDEVRRLIHPGK
jgi:ATP-dependent Zn protease